MMTTTNKIKPVIKQEGCRLDFDEVKISNMAQAVFYMKRGLLYKRVEIVGEDLFFVFDKVDTKEIFLVWLKVSKVRANKKEVTINEAEKIVTGTTN